MICKLSRFIIVTYFYVLYLGKSLPTQLAASGHSVEFSLAITCELATPNPRNTYQCPHSHSALLFGILFVTHRTGLFYFISPTGIYIYSEGMDYVMFIKPLLLLDRCYSGKNINIYWIWNQLTSISLVKCLFNCLPIFRICYAFFY